MESMRNYVAHFPYIVQVGSEANEGPCVSSLREESEAFSSVPWRVVLGGQCVGNSCAR